MIKGKVPFSCANAYGTFVFTYLATRQVLASFGNLYAQKKINPA